MLGGTTLIHSPSTGQTDKQRDREVDGTRIVMAALQTVKLKFHYADFHRNFPMGKVVDTNHESRGHKR